jgi:hypothetical protein
LNLYVITEQAISNEPVFMKSRSWNYPTLEKPARPRPTALLSSSSDGKPEAATAVVAPDDVHEDARNVLSCI